MKRREFILKSTFAALAASVIPSNLLGIAEAREEQMTLLSQTIHPRIIIAPDAVQSELYAANELTTYLNKISGQQLKVEQLVQAPEASSHTPFEHCQRTGFVL